MGDLSEPAALSETALTEKDLTLGERAKLDAVAIPAKGDTVYLSIGSAWHTDPESIAVWGLDWSPDGVAWEHWATCTRQGGAYVDESGAPVTTFWLEVSLLTVLGRGETLRRTGFVRPFLGLLKGTDQTVPRMRGTVEFR